MTDTIVEFCITREQPAPLSLVVQGTDLIPETLAEGLYAAKLHWKDGPGAVPIIIRKLAKFYTTELVVGGRRQPESHVIVVDFISRLVSDRTEQKSYKFSGWLARYDVP